MLPASSSKKDGEARERSADDADVVLACGNQCLMMVVYGG